MALEPLLLKVAPGDSTKFLATDKTHNAESTAGMMPDYAKRFADTTNEEVVVTFEQPNIHGIKCLPHYGMEMVAMIVVCTPQTKQTKAVTHPGSAKQIFANLFGRLEATASK